uniref:Uncharacterized protein n=1 Tax=Arundo donax TaxID=35708 RepID=A0A0A9E8T8_ARUDO
MKLSRVDAWNISAAIRLLKCNNLQETVTECRRYARRSEYCFPDCSLLPYAHTSLSYELLIPFDVLVSNGKNL